MKHAKVALIGAGNIGGQLGYLIASRGLADTVLIEAPSREGIARGKAMDIRQSCAQTDADVTVVGSSDFEDIASADVVVVSAGKPRRPGMKRHDLIGENVPIIQTIAHQIALRAPNAVVITVTNPLDVCSYMMLKETGFHPRRVIGMAGTLDSARLRLFIAETASCSVKDVNALVLGSHGDLMVPLVSHCSINGIPIRELLDESQIQEVMEHTRRAGGEVVSLMGTSGYFCAGESIYELVESCIRDERRVVPCSVYMTGEYGYSDLYMGMPVVVGTNGVEHIVQIRMSNEERETLDKSASYIREMIDQAVNVALGRKALAETATVPVERTLS
jgi:malate dehydrogenase